MDGPKGHLTLVSHLLFLMGEVATKTYQHHMSLQPRNHRTENGCFASNWIVWVFNMSNSSWVVLESQNRFMGIYHPLITKKTTVRIRWASFLHPDLGGNRFVTPSPVDVTLQVYQVKKWSSHIWWVICWGNNHVWWHMMRGGNVVPWRWRGFSQTRGAKFGQPGGWWENPNDNMYIYIYIKGYEKTQFLQILVGTLYVK
jgi:hypothetical protein